MTEELDLIIDESFLYLCILVVSKHLSYKYVFSYIHKRFARAAYLREIVLLCASRALDSLGSLVLSFRRSSFGLTICAYYNILFG